MEDFSKIEVTDNNNGLPIVGIEQSTGKAVAFPSRRIAAIFMGKNTKNEIINYTTKLKMAVEEETILDGYLWKNGKLFVEPTGLTLDEKRKNLIGRVVHGYKVIADTGYRTKNNDHVFLCECVSCGAVRIFDGTGLLKRTISECDCAASVALLNRCVAVDDAVSRMEILAKIHSLDSIAEPAKEQHSENNVYQPKLGRRVYQYEIETGKRIGEFPSAVEAYRRIRPDVAKTLKRTDLWGRATQICRCCRGVSQTAYGSIWRYADEVDAGKAAQVVPRTKADSGISKSSRVEGQKLAAPKPKLEVPAANEKPIECMELNSGHVHWFATLAEACKEVADRYGRIIDIDVVKEACESGGADRFGVYWEYGKKR